MNTKNNLAVVAAAAVVALAACERAERPRKPADVARDTNDVSNVPAIFTDESQPFYWLENGQLVARGVNGTYRLVEPARNLGGNVSTRERWTRDGVAGVEWERTLASQANTNLAPLFSRLQ